MPRLEILHDVRVVVALAAGGVIVIAFALVVVMMMRPRRPAAERPLTGWRGLLASVPWILWLTFAATIAFGILFAWAKIENPPTTW